MEKVARFVISLVLAGLAATAYGQAEPLEVVVWSEDFQVFQPYLVDPCFPDDPCFSGDLPLQDTSWSNSAANAVVVADETFIEEFINEYSEEDPENPFVPDPCNYVLSVQKIDTVGTYAMGYAVKDFAPVAAGVGRFGEYLRLDFDVFRTHAPASWWTDVMRVEVISMTQKNIVELNMINVPYTNLRQLNSVDIPGAAWDGLTWNHYGLFMNFASDYVALYINDEIIPRLVVPFDEDYEPTDIAAIRFGSGVYYKQGRGHSQFYDNILLTANWICPPGDLTGDCAVGLADLAVLASTWMGGPYIAPND